MRRRAPTLGGEMRYEIWSVLAGAYATGRVDATLTHASTITTAGYGVPLCGRVKPESLTKDGTEGDTPTCPACQAKVRARARCEATHPQRCHQCQKRAGHAGPHHAWGYGRHTCDDLEWTSDVALPGDHVNYGGSMT
jgi:hypothetical protein